jgi:tetraacyldisaccharide 4'-kinase
MKTIDRVWARDPVYKAVWIATTPLAVAYSGILATRSMWWRRVARDAPLPTISVGNLTVGGNAKTPFTLFLAARLQERGLRIGIVSRGYGGRGSRRAGLVSDGERLLMTARAAGDEPVMLAKSFNGPVAVARRRIAAIELLANRRLADAVVLDDGFQHLRLRRDLDLLLISQAHGVGNGWVLPAGPMREPLSAIRRADAVVLVGISETAAGTNGFPSEDHLVACSEHLRQAGTPASLLNDLIGDKLVLRAWLQPSGLIRSEGGQWRAENLTDQALAGRRVAAVSGVANPSGFHQMVRRLGAGVVHTLDYPDHHDYRAQDWQNILRAAQQADMLITTEKDLVKLERFPAGGLPVYALRLKVTMNEGDETRLIAMALERIQRAREAMRNRSQMAQGGNGLWR